MADALSRLSFGVLDRWYTTRGAVTQLTRSPCWIMASPCLCDTRLSEGISPSVDREQLQLLEDLPDMAPQ